MTPKSLAFIGGATNSAIGHSHISAALMDGRWKILPSHFSEVEQINEQTHQKFGIPWRKHFQSYLEYLDEMKPLIDLLVIATPSPMHHEMVMEAINRGIPTLVEKPIACSSKEALAIQQTLIGKPQSYLKYVHNYSSYPMYKELERRVTRGDIGVIKHIIAKAPSDGFARTQRTGFPQEWRQTDGAIPMLALDLATHLYHLVHRIQKPELGELLSIANNISAPFSVIDNMQIHSKTKQDVSIDYWFSKAHLGIKNGLSIDVFGDKGSISWVQEVPDQLVVSDLDSNRTTLNRGIIDTSISQFDRFKAGHPTGFVEAMGYFYSDLYDDLESFITDNGGSQWIENAQMACDGIVFLETAYSSSLEKAWKKNVLV